MPRHPHRLAVTVTALALTCAATAPASAELVLLTDGQVLKAAAVAWESDGRAVRVELPTGGAITLAALRVDRVLDDEVEEPPPAPAAVLASASGPRLAWSDDDPVPTGPYGELIHQVARQGGLNPGLVAALTRAESAFQPRAVSHKGARGLMQLMPATAARFGVAPGELFDPVRNVTAGTRYLQALVKLFPERPDLVLAAYNAGENAVARYRGVPPYRETRDYVRKIYATLGFADPLASAPSGVVAAVAAPAGRR